MLFAQAVVGVGALVLRRGQTQHRAQRRNDLVRIDRMIAAHAAAKLRAARGLDDHVVARADGQCAGIEEIVLAAAAELHVADRDRRFFGLFDSLIGPEGFVGFHNISLL